MAVLKLVSHSKVRQGPRLHYPFISRIYSTCSSIRTSHALWPLKKLILEQAALLMCSFPCHVSHTSVCAEGFFHLILYFLSSPIMFLLCVSLCEWYQHLFCQSKWKSGNYLWMAEISKNYIFLRYLPSPTTRFEILVPPPSLWILSFLTSTLKQPFLACFWKLSIIE